MIPRPRHEYTCTKGHWSGSYREPLTRCPHGTCSAPLTKVPSRQSQVTYPRP